MNTGILFLCGRLRALESRLLDKNKLDRMIGAASADDAFRVLTELQYSEYFDESVRPADFEKIIESGLLETKKMIAEFAENCGLEFLWQKFDINNLKRAAKIKFLEQKNSIKNFSENGGFSLLGNFSKQKIEEIIFQKNLKNLPEILATACENAEKNWKKNQDFREIENIFDRAHFANLQKIAKKLRSKFLKNFFEIIVDSANFVALARSILIFQKNLAKKFWIAGGNFNFCEIEKIDNFADFEKWAAKTKFANFTKKIAEFSDEEKIYKIEKRADIFYKNFVRENAAGQYGTIQIPINYFEQRLANARMIKFVMSAKINGMPPEKIYKVLENF